MRNSLAKCLFICSLLVTGCAADIFGKTYVEINSNLSAATTLTVHCKSKNDDLGDHTITSTRSWGFKFRPNFFKTTLFFCSFAWPNEFHRFDIYDENRDECTECIWTVFPNGPCKLNETRGIDFCYPWKASMQLGRKPLM
ncbi:hypothetical protein ACJRO7_026345 [Eucalyptus globulus]|uniref:S-protein homolog n=1 Tax=Eucalyptus globulus TaxID=34317 RepID=A0ABD3JQG7_EUCGL